ncbi:hypothetical protein [Streptomyces sp. NPDC000229]|uniref:hypothetical protein n=1 Tax=Streptomyces sp. NPDC000229 TaxID=3154247 RepID=UPI0033217C8E
MSDPDPAPYYWYDPATGQHWFDKRVVHLELISQWVSGRPELHARWSAFLDQEFPFFKAALREAFRTEAAVKNGAEHVLTVLKARGIDVPDAARERITTCVDPGLLRGWLTRAVTAATAADIFADE